jgi:hypothetical protein
VVKPVSFFVLAIICAVIAFYYLGMSLQSVDYRDGVYHPIPRERYGITLLVSLVATIVFYKLGRRSLRPTDAAR